MVSTISTYSLTDKLVKVFVHLVLVSAANTMGTALVDLLFALGQQFECSFTRGLWRHDLIVITVEDQCWNVNSFQIFSLISFREGSHAIVKSLDGSLHSLIPEAVNQTLRLLRLVMVETIEQSRQVLEKLRSVLQHVVPDIVKSILGNTVRVEIGLYHERWNSTNEDCFTSVFGAVTSKVPCNLPTASGVSHMNSVLQAQVVDKLSQVVSVLIHIVTQPRL